MESTRPQLPPVLDLFAGCGGLSLGFERAGFQILHAYDNWVAAVDTYRRNFTHPASLLDLGDVQATLAELSKYRQDTDSFPIIIGGPPCQDFSSAGRRIEGARADLTEKFAQIVAALQPPVFVMENVARAQSAAAFQRAVTMMRESSYSVVEVVLDASLCGVPQKRKRLFTIGAHDPELVRNTEQLLCDRQSSRPMTLRDFFGDSLGTETYYRHPRSYARRGVFSIDEPSPTIRGVNRPIPAGYEGHPGDAGPVADSRPLTTAERARIQTFPADFKFTGSRTSIEQMIGNAVPVGLARYVAGALADACAECALPLSRAVS